MGLITQVKGFNMRCVACNSVIDTGEQPLDSRMEYCDDCYFEINKDLNDLEYFMPHLEDDYHDNE